MNTILKYPFASFKRKLRMLPIMAGSLILTAYAADPDLPDYHWNKTGVNGTWTAASSWLNPSGDYTGYPDGGTNGVFVRISRDAEGGVGPLASTGNQNVCLGGVDTTVGRLDIGNLGNSTVNAGTGVFKVQGWVAGNSNSAKGALHFVGYEGGNAQLNQLNGVLGGSEIHAAIVLSSSLDISNPSSQILNIFGGISSRTAGLKTISVKNGSVILGGDIVGGSGSLNFVIDNGASLQMGSNANSVNDRFSVGDIINNGLLTFSNYTMSTTKDVVSGNISGTGNLIVNNAGYINLRGENTYTGSTVFNKGTITIESAENLGSASGNILFQGSGAWTQLNIVGDLTLAKNIEINNDAPARIFVDPGKTAVFSGDIGGSGTGNLTKRGNGSLILNGDASRLGSTSVENGTMTINGDFSNATGDVVVQKASAQVATLGGNGIIGGAVFVNDGTLAPGNSIGVLTLKSNLTIASAGQLAIELGRNGVVAVSDRVNVAGAVSFASGAELLLSVEAGLSAPELGDIFFILSKSGTDPISGLLSFDGTELSEGDVFSWASLVWKITYQADFDGSSFTGGNDIAIQAIPEPATWALIFGLATVTLVCFRRRK